MMTYTDYMAFEAKLTGNVEHDHALIRAHPLSDVWQLKALLELTTSAADAQLIVEVNPKLSQELADSLAVYARFDQVDPVADAALDSVRAAATPEIAAGILGALDARQYEAVSGALLFDGADAERACRLYLECVL
jgi:hypothetical protein